LLHIPHLELADDFLAALHIKISVRKDTTAIAFAEHHKAPFIEGARDAGGEIRLHNTFATPCFAFLSGFDAIE
jgi:hypothetical protein